jgi:hypothetical protein
MKRRITLRRPEMDGPVRQATHSGCASPWQGEGLGFESRRPLHFAGASHEIFALAEHFVTCLGSSGSVSGEDFVDRLGFSQFSSLGPGALGRVTGEHLPGGQDHAVDPLLLVGRQRSPDLFAQRRRKRGQP